MSHSTTTDHSVTCQFLWNHLNLRNSTSTKPKFSLSSSRSEGEGKISRLTHYQDKIWARFQYHLTSTCLTLKWTNLCCMSNLRKVSSGLAVVLSISTYWLCKCIIQVVLVIKNHWKYAKIKLTFYLKRPPNTGLPSHAWLPLSAVHGLSLQSDMRSWES